MADKPVSGAASPGFLEALRRPYKADQGVVTRRIAFGTVAAFALWGAMDLWVWLQGFAGLKASLFGEGPMARIPLVQVEISGSLLIAAGLAGAAIAWAAWYLKRPWLADLLIETESEMKKVSWPARGEAWAATRVVTATVIVFTLVLMVFDGAIGWVLRLLTNRRI